LTIEQLSEKSKVSFTVISKLERNTKESEICSVMSGIVKITYSNQTYVSKKGETIQFGAYFNHKYEVLEDCEIILTHITEKEFPA